MGWSEVELGQKGEPLGSPVTRAAFNFAVLLGYDNLSSRMLADHSVAVLINETLAKQLTLLWSSMGER